MKFLSRLAVTIAAAVALLAPFAGLYAANELDARTTTIKTGTNKNSDLDTFGNNFSDSFFRASGSGDKAAYNTVIGIARDLKNLFIAIAVVMLVISVLKLLFSKGGDDDVKKWKSSIVWSTLGIIVMQSAYVFVTTLYDKEIQGRTASVFLDKIVYPFVSLMEVLASFAFLAIAFLAFFRMVTAGGDEDKIKSAKRSIITGIVGFMVLKIPKALVTSVYGSVHCTNTLIFGMCKLEDPNLSGTVSIMTNVLNYVNGFLGIVTVLLIVWAGWLVLSSGGDEEKLKQAKNIVKYIFVGIFLLVTSYILFNFFLGKDTQ